MFRDQRTGRINAGEGVVIVDAVELVVFGNDHAAGEEVRGEQFVLPSQLYCVENATDIVPGKRSDEALFSVAQLLSANFKGKRKFFVVPDRDIGLVQIDPVGLRPMSFVCGGARNGRVFLIGKTILTDGNAASPFGVGAPPFVGVPRMEANARKEIFVVNVGSVIAKIE